MFSKLVSRNSKRDRKNNGLYFSSMVLSIISFYIILSLSHQDVMHFLKQIESDAVNKLFSMIPILYVATLFILFFLVYFSSSMQMERRKHEFGVYLTLGMQRSKLFLLLLLEDLRNSVLALGIGLPISILISELISLITAKIVGLGIIEHQFSLSTTALLYTVIGFLAVKLAVFVLLSTKTANMEIGNLLAYSPSGMKKLLPKGVYLLASVLGILLLGTAYYMGMSGQAWENVITMGITVLLGTLGTILLFFGMRLFIDFLVKLGNNRKLHAYNFRQIQELVIQRSTILAVCSLLIFSALCLFGAGVAIASGNPGNQTHVLDYTFRDSKQETDENLDVNAVKKELEAAGLVSQFSKILQIKVGQTKEHESVSFEEVIKEFKNQKDNKNKEILLHKFKQSTNSHLIPVSEYNELRKAANLPPLELTNKEAYLYMGKDFLPDESLVNSVLKTKSQIKVMGNDVKLIGEVESLPIVTDHEITLSVALIVPDEIFMSYTDGRYSNYVSGILAPELVKGKGLIRAISDTNEKLNQTSLGYESYIQNMGRQLFYIISASYVTIYLSIIFLVVANTIIGVQFLMGQRQSYRRYQTLIHLGANYETLCKSSEKQINWYFGLPIALALISSSFGVSSLLTGIVPASARMVMGQKFITAMLIVLLLAGFEVIYIRIVKKNSNKYLLSLMKPKRDE